MNQTEQPMNPVEQSAPKLTIEQEQEQKLKSKYPNPQKPGGSAFIHKMLHKGSRKYFDSGDYNMAKSKKQGLLNGLGKGTAQPVVANPQHVVHQNNASTPVSQARSEGMQPQFNNSTDQAMSTSDINSPSFNTTGGNISNEPLPMSHSNTSNIATLTPDATADSNNSMNSSSSELPKPCTPNQKPAAMSQFDSSQNTSQNNSNFLNTSNKTTSPLSSSLSSTNLQNSNPNYYINPMVLQTSQSSQSISLMSSSMSTDKIAQIQINQQQMIDSEEIGHEIPTPECLPQSRKHSIVQSKLATPRLSSS